MNVTDFNEKLNEAMEKEYQENKEYYDIEAYNFYAPVIITILLFIIIILLIIIAHRIKKY